MVKLKNRKGQTWEFIVLGAIGIALLVIVILYLFKGSNIVEGVVNDIPSALAAKLEICKSVVSNPVAFCEFTELTLPKVGKGWVNCRYPGKEFSEAISQLTSPPSCSGIGVEGETAFCNSIKDAAGFKGANINGLKFSKDCSAIA